MSIQTWSQRRSEAPVGVPFRDFAAALMLTTSEIDVPLVQYRSLVL